MSPIYIIYFVSSIVIWAVVPFRQIGKKYFYFFYFLICQDAFTYAARFVFHSNTNIFYILFDLACYISIQGKDVSKPAKIFISLICLFSVILEAYGLNGRQEIFLLASINLLLFFKFLHSFIKTLVNDNNINLFLITLVFYELLSVTKFIGVITGFARGVVYFNTTTAFELIIGLFFCVFRYNSQLMSVKPGSAFPDTEKLK